MLATANPDAAARAFAPHRGMLWFTGVAAIVIGTLALVYPLAASFGVGFAVGALLLALGGVEIVRAFQMRRTGRILGAALFGLLAVVAGVTLIAFPGAGVITLTFVLIAYLLAGGALRVASAFQARPLKAWPWMLASGAISFLLGVLLWLALPGAALWALGLIFGVDAVFFGFAQIALALAARDNSAAGANASAGH